MRYITIILSVGIIGLVSWISFTLLSDPLPTEQNPGADPVLPIGGQQQVITPLPDRAAGPIILFGSDQTPELEVFIGDHVNKEVFALNSCGEGDPNQKLTLVVNFAPNSQGLNTTEAGEAYMRQNYDRIAPGFVSALTNEQFEVDQISVFAYSMFDRGALIYQAPVTLDRSPANLYHTWIGNTVIFSLSLDCVTEQLLEFYESH